MKHLPILFFTLILTSCASQKKMETENLPFEVGRCFAQQWAAGRGEGGSGMELTVMLLDYQKDVRFKNIYFRGRSLTPSLVAEEGQSYLKASYRTDQEDKLHSDKEQQMTDFQLTADEAVISFSYQTETTKYFKVEEIEQKKGVRYKGRLKY